MALQSHLSNRKVDDFLEIIMTNFSTTAQQVLKVCPDPGGICEVN
jgi:hypothetical protein